MYRLPPDVDLSFFHGKTLLQICIGANEVIFNFDGCISVTVMSQLECHFADGAREVYEDFRAAAALIVKFIGTDVKTARGNQLGTLTLEFEGGGSLSIFDDSDQFESYTIKNGNKLIVV